MFFVVFWIKSDNLKEYKNVMRGSEKVKMDKIDKREQEDRNFSTQGHKKLWNYFLEVSKTDYFRNTILELRKKYKIPENGYKCAETYTTPPQEWRIQMRGLGKSGISENIKIFKDIKPICEKYHLHYADWSEVIEDYLFFNKLRQIMHTNSYSLCLLSDLIEEKREPFGKDFTGSDDFFYPIAIRISPYASERDIVDYVKKMFPAIKAFQKPYINPEVKIGKVKRKKPSIQKRNNFIYDNRQLSLNETKRLVEEKFGESLDYEYIGKIRSDEAKKRKEL